jgi:hypothetical protein
MAELLCDCMQQWITGHPITHPMWPLPLVPIHRSILQAYTSQSKIGWDQLFRGQISVHWKHAIGLYYKE